MLDEAIIDATQCHAGQYDKNGDPYILHPLRVMLAVSALTSDKNMLVAAVLHDVVEDCGISTFAIEKKFGHFVAVRVFNLTRRPGESYVEFIERCSSDSFAKIIKIEDIKDNLRPGTPHLRDKYLAALKVLET